jgi:hypothetical protein
MNIHTNAVKQYSLDTLEAIERDLVKNPKSYQHDSWEYTRLDAIRAEIKRRRTIKR